MKSGWIVGAFITAALSAGCMGQPTVSDDGGPSVEDRSLVVSGAVVDVELIPLSDAIVLVEPGDHQTITGPDGAFEIVLLEPASYTLTAVKDGYADGTVDITVGTDPDGVSVMIQLVPVSTHVPYHETIPVASVIGCAVATPTSRITCGLIEQVTGVELVPDSSVFSFTILADGLADLLVETEWESTQAFARELSVNVLDQEGDQTNCLSTKCYAEAVAGSPVRFHLIPGERWQDDELWEPFNGEAGHGYNVYLMPPFGSNVDNAVSVYLDQQVDSYLTFFYNRLGSEGFTALPDA